MRVLASIILLALLLPSTNDRDGGGVGGADVVVGNEHNTVVISGTQTQSSPKGNKSPQDSSSSPASPENPQEEFDLDSCLDDWNSSRSCFRAREKEGPQSRPTAASPAAPAITITDLAQFAPEAIATLAEPDNVGIAGMPTNLVAAASVQIRSGTLLGAPLSVRFTPVGYDFIHGDDTALTTSTGGQSWAALGQAPFTPTATSHTYRKRGTYQAHATVRYAAEVDLGGGWFPVAGALTIEGPTQEIRIFEARTALVAFTCAQRPSAPGC